MPALIGVLGALLTAWLWLGRGWVPHDEGLLGQAAERTLGGAWPHRNFIDTYTGGQAHWHALSMRVFGVTAMATRWAILPFFAAFLAAFHDISRRLIPPLAALGCTLLAMLLTLPNYPAAMPSWYGLFLAVVAAWFALEGVRARRGGWWLAAGVTAGVSILFKITGLYTVAALGLILFEHERALREADGAATTPWTRPVAAAVTCATLGLALLAIATGFDTTQAVSSGWHFGLPFAVWLSVIAALAWRGGSAATRTSVGTATRHGALLAIGVGLPVVAFALPYAAQGALGALFEGVFVLPMRRMQAAAQPLPCAATIPLALAWLGVLAADTVRQRRVTLGVNGVLLLVLLLALLGPRPETTRWVFTAMRQVLPAAVLVAALQLWRARRPQPELVALTSLALLSSLIQVPFAGPLYALHFAPTVILAVVVLLRAGATPRRGAHAALLVFLLVFTATNLGWPRMPWLRGEDQVVRTQPMGLERAQLEVGWYHARVYGELTQLVRELTQPGEPILAMLDCPEVHLLTGAPNTTPWFYEFLADPEDLTLDAFVERINEHGIRVMVVNEQHRFSGEEPHRIAEQLKRGFDHHRSIAIEHVDPQTGQAASTEFFTVHWRGTAPAGDNAP